MESQFVADTSERFYKRHSNFFNREHRMTGRQIAFSVADSGVHVYTLDINSVSNVGSCVTVNSLVYTSNEGTTPAESGGNLAIVSIDPVKRLMSGTFNFKAFRQQDGTQKIITEGVFNNISY